MGERLKAALSITLGVLLASTFMTGLTSITTPPQVGVTQEEDREVRSPAMVEPEEKGAGSEFKMERVEPYILDPVKVGVPFAFAFASSLLVFVVVGRKISR